MKLICAVGLLCCSSASVVDKRLINIAGDLSELSHGRYVDKHTSVVLGRCGNYHIDLIHGTHNNFIREECDHGAGNGFAPLCPYGLVPARDKDGVLLPVLKACLPCTYVCTTVSPEMLRTAIEIDREGKLTTLTHLLPRFRYCGDGVLQKSDNEECDVESPGCIKCRLRCRNGQVNRASQALHCYQPCCRGWRGPYCEQSTCVRGKPNTKKHGDMCVPGSCSVGWTGPACSDPLCVNGVLGDDPEGKCDRCYAGYAGPYCSQIIVDEEDEETDDSTTEDPQVGVTEVSSVGPGKPADPAVADNFSVQGDGDGNGNGVEDPDAAYKRRRRERQQRNRERREKRTKQKELYVEWQENKKTDPGLAPPPELTEDSIGIDIGDVKDKIDQDERESNAKDNRFTVAGPKVIGLLAIFAVFIAPLISIFMFFRSVNTVLKILCCPRLFCGWCCRKKKRRRSADDDSDCENDPVIVIRRPPPVALSGCCQCQQ